MPTPHHIYYIKHSANSQAPSQLKSNLPTPPSITFPPTGGKDFWTLKILQVSISTVLPAMFTSPATSNNAVGLSIPTPTLSLTWVICEVLKNPTVVAPVPEVALSVIVTGVVELRTINEHERPEELLFPVASVRTNLKSAEL